MTQQSFVTLPGAAAVRRLDQRSLRSVAARRAQRRSRQASIRARTLSSV